MKHFVASNGALVWAHTSSSPGPTRLIVAGQHGNETGPIEALSGWFPKAGGGTTVVVQCANPVGYALRHRYCTVEVDRPRPAREIDLNRGWLDVDPNAVCAEIWAAAVGMCGRVPHVVVDLHSSTTPAFRGTHPLHMGRLALPANEESRELAGRIVDAALLVEPGWAVRLGVSRDGALHNWAAQNGAVAVAVEFDESGRSDGDRRRGVAEVLNAVLEYAP